MFEASFLSNYVADEIDTVFIITLLSNGVLTCEDFYRWDDGFLHFVCFCAFLKAFPLKLTHVLVLLRFFNIIWSEQLPIGFLVLQLDITF